jgi:hypothetical protein
MPRAFVVFLGLSKIVFGQPLTVIALPKAQIIIKLTALKSDFGAFGGGITIRSCPKYSFGQLLEQKRAGKAK